MLNLSRGPILVALIALLSVGCKEESTTGVSNDETTVTWYIASRSYSAADIYLNTAYVGTIRGQYNGNVTCGMESGVGRLTMTLEAGQNYGWRGTAYCATCVQGQQQVFPIVGSGWTAERGRCYLAAIR